MIGKKTVFFLALTFLLFAACQIKTPYDLRNGQQILDLKLPNLEGDSLRLLGVENKLVLLDFWASWCKPCRENHPELLRIYHQYQDSSFQKAEGFEVFSVSLDDKERSWKKAIQDDGLDFTYHVADLRGMRKSAIPLRFQFEQIPSSFLINSEGRIIGKNLSLNAMEAELKHRLKR